MAIAPAAKAAFFDGVCGHEHIKKQLIAALESRRAGHAYIFEGKKGVGRYTTAAAFARALTGAESVDHPDIVTVRNSFFDDSKSDDGALYVLLCDGMGSGARAGQESSLAVSLLEQFLRAGVPPERAMETVAEALGLRNEEEGSFTTVDLLRVDLFTGETGVYKYGAAPTYVKRGGQVSRVTGTSLPAGLSGQPGSPDVTRLTLSAGDCVLLVSDGVSAGESDLWIRERLAAFDGESPRELAGALITESGTRGGAVDDRTALVLRLSSAAS